MKLYEQLANTIVESIQNGLFCRGDKLPSIRHTSQKRSISPSTVFQAYRPVNKQTPRLFTPYPLLTVTKKLHPRVGH